MSEKCTYCDSLRECVLTEQRYGDELRTRAIAAEACVLQAAHRLRAIGHSDSAETIEAMLGNATLVAEWRKLEDERHAELYAARDRAATAEALGAVGYELLGQVLRGIAYLPDVLELAILTHLDLMEKAQPRLVLAAPPKEKL